MASSDEPPFLNVGTEVSAKYRGAFCEATIKIAKKVVKCKISYNKGLTDTISNDLVKGPLKVGANVEVRQNDGQYLPGVIQKLTDASTYTVVFDDGDERTLRRSSLCLKGGRHYSASESLDQMPLTDPENFSTPAPFPSKRGTRRRRHPSQSSSHGSESHSPVKEPHISKYPPEYPVGKCVFLENDRRRAGWVPGVIVPAHFVMEESEMTEDTICIRSFKDGRFFAAKTSELRDFAPDKEPLSSMLDGEIQPMYLCKPAIERAMAYLDTNELPWDMDLGLFDSREDQNNSLNNHPEESGNCEDKVLSEEYKQEMDDFYLRLEKFHEDKGVSFIKSPSLAGEDLDLFKLYCLVRENGGMEKVTQELKWRSLYLQMGIPQYPNSSHLIKQAYRKHLHGFEVFEKARLDGKPIKTKRRSTTIQESDEDSDKLVKTTIDLNQHNPTEMNGIPAPQSSTPVSGEPPSESVQQLNNSSALASCEYKVGDRVNVLYGKGKGQRTYEAKIIEAEEILPKKIMFNVHYNGWNSRYDEWIETNRITGKATGPGGRHSGRGSYSKKKHGRLKAQEQQKGGNGRNKMAANTDVDHLSSSSSFNEFGSPIMAPETPPSYWSGSDTGGVGVGPSMKTPKSTGGNNGSGYNSITDTSLAQRRRISSATESSSNNSDNPQSPDSIPSYTHSHSLLSTQQQPSSHPLMKQQYTPFSPPPLPPSITAQPVVPLTTPPPPICTRVPIILSPDRPPIPMCTPPQESIANHDHDTPPHQLVTISKEENTEYLKEYGEMEESNELKQHEGDRQSSPTGDDKHIEEPLLHNLQDTVSDSTTPPTMETELSNPTQDMKAIIKREHGTSPSPVSTNTTTCTSEDRQQQLDAAAYSLIQPNSSSYHSSLPGASAGSTPSLSSDSPITTATTSSHPLSPPMPQSENSSIIGSSNESDQEMSIMTIESKHLSTSSSSVSPDMLINHHHDDGDSPRKRKSGNDSGVENGSESDYTETKRSHREDLDFSIDMTDLNGLTTTERIGRILERMKDIQKKYMELKTEVTYLDRRRRRARKNEKEAAKLLSSPDSHSFPSQATPSLHQTMPTPTILPLTLSSSSHKQQYQQPQTNSNQPPVQIPPLHI